MDFFFVNANVEIQTVHFSSIEKGAFWKVAEYVVRFCIH